MASEPGGFKFELQSVTYISLRVIILIYRHLYRTTQLNINQWRRGPPTLTNTAIVRNMKFKTRQTSIGISIHPLGLHPAQRHSAQQRPTTATPRIHQHSKRRPRIPRHSHIEVPTASGRHRGARGGRNGASG
jgi:hypothetical protein